MKTNILSLLTALTLLGCAGPKTAVVDGQKVQRPSLAYTDHDLFAIEHQRAWPTPRGPSSGLRAYGGTVWGRVCGSDVNFDTQYHGRYLELSGFVTPARARGSQRVDHSLRFEARDRDGAREIIGMSYGSMMGVYGPPIVDFRYSPDMLEGQIGWKHFSLRRKDDQLVGTVTELGEVSPFVVDGIDELWMMPAPDQVALMPLMMTCSYDHAFANSSIGPDVQLPISFRDKSARAER